MLDEAFRRYGVAEGLPADIREAVRTTPRHRFVHRFLKSQSEKVQDLDADPLRHLAAVYSDQIQTQVNASGEALPSTNSQPSYVLWLVKMLGLLPGHRVLEIGSGSGWLAAVMARLVGPHGHVTGIEIIAELAERSRQDIEALGVGNVSIFAGDGAQFHGNEARYERAIVTAAVWDLPVTFFDHIVDGGLILVPIEQRAGVGCHVTLLRRANDRFVAERIVHGFFVPFVGQTPVGEETALERVALWPDAQGVPTARRTLWLATAEPGSAVALAFRIFLGQTEPDFAVFGKGLSGLAGLSAPFGLVDATARSSAICRSGELICYGALDAGRRLASAYRRWTELGMPGPSAFELDIVRADKAPEASDGVWVERRGESALVWRLKPGGESWRALIDDADRR